jgi:uncharacterized protein YndB with AHSA1/START domain
MSENITIKTFVSVPIEKVWKYWNEPEHITKWCNASPEWQTPRATNDLSVGGKFLTRMEAKDGSQGFDFEGTYTNIKPGELIAYEISGGRKVSIQFVQKDGGVEIIETFEAENENPIEMQRAGWQAILDNFKNYTQ